MPNIAAPTAAEIAAKSKPSPEGKALLTPTMTPPQYQQALEKNKLPVDSVHFLAHGLPERHGLCWACQSCRLVGPKLSPPELDLLKLTEAWLKHPTPDFRLPILAGLGKVDFTGPGSWAGQGAIWAKIPGVPPLPPIPGMPAVGLVAAAVVGAILLAAGLKIGPPMPLMPKPKLPLPLLPPTPKMLLELLKPKLPVPPPLPVLDQPKLMKLLFPFIDIGKGVSFGKIRCW